MITRRDFTKLSMGVAALIASGRHFEAQTPSIDGNNEGVSPRRIGKRVHGTYWRSGTEHIDLLSGNLQFAIFLAKPISRRLGALLSASYNSQSATLITSTAAKTHPNRIAYDIGYGHGWKIQFASVVPTTSADGAQGYTLIDGTGAEYVLTQIGNVWVSLHGSYQTWDPSTQNAFSTKRN